MTLDQYLFHIWFWEVYYFLTQMWGSLGRWFILRYAAAAAAKEEEECLAWAGLLIGSGTPAMAIASSSKCITSTFITILHRAVHLEHFSPTPHYLMSAIIPHLRATYNCKNSHIAYHILYNWALTQWSLCAPFSTVEIDNGRALLDSKTIHVYL